MKLLSLIDVEMGLKKGIYKFFNNAEGKVLVWDAQKRTYIGHVDVPELQREAQSRGIDLPAWVGYGKGGGWGSSGW